MPFPWFRILRLLKHSVFQIKLWTKRNVWGVLTFNHLTVEISLKNTPKSLLWPKNPKLLLFWKKTYALCRLIGIGHQHPKIDHLMRFCTSRAWNPPKTENFESVPPKTFDSNKFHNNKKKRHLRQMKFGRNLRNMIIFSCAINVSNILIPFYNTPPSPQIPSFPAPARSFVPNVQVHQKYTSVHPCNVCIPSIVLPLPMVTSVVIDTILWSR